jgi:DMSO reductase anchor subunit
MHPAFSVIFLTTLIGIGQGLFLALYTGEVYALFKVLPSQGSQQFYGLGSLVVLVFLGLGLLASFFHLGHPERAWRAAAKWRTSWLSREVIALPAFMGTVFLYGAAHWLELEYPVVYLGTVGLSLPMLLGAAATVLCFTLFVCTGMIYACIKFLQEWHSPLTVFNFILLGGASGFTLATAFAHFTAPDLVEFYGVWAIILTGAALLTRGASLIRNARLKPKSTLQTAIGVRHNKVAQKAQGFMGSSFNTREFFHHMPPSVVRSVKWVFLVLVFPVPVVLLGSGLMSSSVALMALAVLTQYAGLLAERWFFFAQANHPQNLYYQSIS